MKSEAINNAIKQKLQQISPLQIAYWLGGLAADNLELFSELLSCAFTYKENSVKLTLLQALPIEIVYLIYIERKPQNLAQLKFALPYLQSMDTPAAHLLSARLCLDGNGDIQGIEANKAAFRHLKICIGHAGFTQLTPRAQAVSHYGLAVLYRVGRGDIQGVEANKAAFRHFETCISHAGFSQLPASSQQEVLDRFNELKHLLSQSSRGLSSDKLGSTESLQLLADCADAPPLHPSASASMGLLVANPVPSQKRKAEDGHMSTSSKMPRLSSSQDTETDVVMVEGFAFRSSKRSY